MIPCSPIQVHVLCEHFPTDAVVVKDLAGAGYSAEAIMRALHCRLLTRVGEQLSGLDSLVKDARAAVSEINDHILVRRGADIIARNKEPHDPSS